MPAKIIERGRGPEIEGTRVTVYRIMDFVREGDGPELIAADLDLTREQVDAALAYIAAHRPEVEAEYEKILERVNQPTPPWVVAGQAATLEELRRRIEARRAGAVDHAPPV